MAYYDEGKHTFKSIIDSVKNDISKEFLEYKCSRHYISSTPNSKRWVEQMLYNEDCESLKDQLSGFVAGKLYKKRSAIDYDQVVIQEEVMTALAKIRKEMVNDNNWDADDQASEWNVFLGKY